MNTRSDRRYRTQQLISLIANKIQPNQVIIRGDDLPNEVNLLVQNEDVKLKKFPSSTLPEEIFEYFNTIDSQFIMGIGNIVGWGDQFVSKLKEFRT